MRFEFQPDAGTNVYFADSVNLKDFNFMEMEIIRQTLNLEYTMFFLNHGTVHGSIKLKIPSRLNATK